MSVRSRVRTGSSVMGMTPGSHAHPLAEIGGDGGQGFAGLQAARPLQMQGHIAVTQAKPGLAAQRLHRLHERPGFVVPAPAELAVGQA